MEIYLDNAATTYVSADVAKEVLKVMTKYYANSSSKNSVGFKVSEEIEEARKKIANYIGAKPSEIIFTSGATESNNLAIRGVAMANPEKKHIITTAIEHASVLETCFDLEKNGYYIDYIDVDKGGLIDPKKIKDKIRKDTLLVSVMHANNEVGTVQFVEEIAKICSSKGVYFHSDAVQTFTKVKIDVSKTAFDLISVSGHKFHGPKGVGFLYVRSKVKILPMVTGGGQEKNLRSGTLNSSGIIGMAKALDFKVDLKKVLDARERIVEGLLRIKKSKLNGSSSKRLPGNINVSFEGIDGEELTSELSKKGIYVSNGSACSSIKSDVSHVLKALGVEEKYLYGAIRLSFEELGDKEIKYVVDSVGECVEKLRKEKL